MTKFCLQCAMAHSVFLGSFPWALFYAKWINCVFLWNLLRIVISKTFSQTNRKLFPGASRYRLVFE